MDLDFATALSQFSDSARHQIAPREKAPLSRRAGPEKSLENDTRRRTALNRRTLVLLSLVALVLYIGIMVIMVLK